MTMCFKSFRLGQRTERSPVRRHALAASAAAAVLGCSGLVGAAWAQDQGGQGADQTAQAQSQAGGSQLQEVVVTAERRAENIQTTPIAVTAITGDQLKANNITSVNDLALLAPTLSVANEGGYQLVVMRGVGNTLGEDPVTTGVPVVLDNMINPRGTGLNWAWFDIGDVETLRGPQGTLVGVNSTGGAIVVNSANPNFRGVNGYVTAQLGNYHDDLEEAAVNLPVSDTFAMRLAMHSEVENSFYSDVGFSKLPDGSDAALDPGNTDMRDVRLSALWKPTDNLQILFKLQYDENNTDGTPYNVSPNTFAPLPGLGCPYAEVNGQCQTEYQGNYSGNPWVLNYSTFTKYEYWDRFYSGDIRYTLPGGTVFHFYAGSEASETPEIDPNCDCSQNDGFGLGGGSGITAEPGTNDYVQMELISPATGKFNWIVGAAYVWSMSPFTDFSVTTGPASAGDTPAAPGLGYFPLDETARDVGVYANINWQFTDTLQLEAGLRGNWDNNFGTGTFNIYPSGACTLPCNAIPQGATPTTYAVLNNVGGYTNNHQTGKIGLNWTPLPGEFFYAFAARGYKPGLTQFHAFTEPEVPAAAETLDDYEIGWKGTFLGGKLTNQLGIYYDNYYNMQQNVFNQNNPNNGGIAPVPHALIDGIEESLQAQIGHFGANISAAYTHSDLSPIIDVPTYEFPPGFASAGFGSFQPACPKGTPSSSTCAAYYLYQINLSGAKDPYAPELTTNITVQYGFPIGQATLQPRVQFSYTSKQYSNILQNNDYYEMGQRQLWNAYLDFLDGRWDTTLYGTNLSNQTYTTNQTGTTVLYGPPLQFGVKTTFNF
ncbi:MAG TPA: TonB-dependent receptor [Steroidobacteraceae bacterium]|jgi:iron complex outermembrane receptor protein|nr:TonB-dependent receptor [Steroidobacteraceae bacterium]